jgi:hypothetical protein
VQSVDKTVMNGEIERTGKEENVILKIYIGIQLGTRLRLNLTPSEYSKCTAVELTLFFFFFFFFLHVYCTIRLVCSL